MPTNMKEEIKIEKSEDPSPDKPGKIIVSGIPKDKDFDEAQLEKEFGSYGRITEGNEFHTTQAVICSIR